MKINKKYNVKTKKAQECKFLAQILGKKCVNLFKKILYSLKNH